MSEHLQFAVSLAGASLAQTGRGPSPVVQLVDFSVLFLEQPMNTGNTRVLTTKQ